MLIPPINSEGLFRLQVPLDTLIRNDIRYKVSAIRNISEILEEDIDVKTIIYLDQGLTEEDYNEDLVNKNPIVILVNPSNEYFNIPSSKILSIPDVTGIVFKDKVIVINLGQIYDTLSLDYILDDLKDIVIDNVGITPTIEIMDVSQQIIYTEDELKEFEQKRAGTIANNTDTCKNRLTKSIELIEGLKARLEIYVERLKQLEA